MSDTIFDMDGTLVNVEPVRHYVRGSNRNFDKFHKSSLFCPPNPDVLGAAHAVISPAQNIIVTARDTRYKQVTVDWLAKYRVPYSGIYMRPFGDTRPDHVVKRDLFWQMVHDGFDPVHAFDDRDDIAHVWRSFGLTVTLVGDGQI